METAAPFSKPVLAYHGTSARFLRDILKHGMTPARTRVGRWAGAASDPDASAHTRSRQSYGGVYWTTNLMTARSAATNQLIAAAGGWAAVTDNVLIVCARIQPQGAVPDEDLYAVRAANLGHEALWPYMLIGERLRVRTDSAADFNRAVMAWVAHTAGAAPRQDLRQLKALAREVFLTELERTYAYQPFTEYSRTMRRALDRVQPGGYELPLPRALRVPSPTIAEARARSALDLYIHKVRGETKRRTDAGEAWNSFRTTEPVTYRGSNRIVCVVELAKRGGEAVVRWGALPDDFREQYRQRVGDLHVVDTFSPPQESAAVTIETSPPRVNPQTAFTYGGIHYDPRVGLGAVPDLANIDYLGLAVVITPRQFERLTKRLENPEEGTIPHIVNALEKKKPLGMPFLAFNFEQFRVRSHEGRHRCRAITQFASSMADIVVAVFPTGGDRARDITVEQIERFASGDVQDEYGMDYAGGRLFDHYWHRGAWHTITRTHDG